MGRKRSRKRANGEGAVYPHRGRWAGQVTLGTDPITGKPIQRSVYGDTQTEARTRLDEIKAEAAAKKPGPT